jgi:hypothetical protein
MSASPALRRRPSRSWPAALTALVLLAAGALLAIAAIARLTGGSWPAAWQSVTDAATGAAWGSTAVWVAVVLALVLGLVLLLAALVPGAHRTARLDRQGSGAARQTELVVTSRGLARLAAAAGDSVDGVDRVSVSASGRTVRVRVQSSTRDDATLVKDRVKQVVTDRLQQAGVTPAAQVRVAVVVKEA